MRNPADRKHKGPAAANASDPLRALNTRPGAPPLYQQIAADLRTRIETGDLPPGAPLPSETAVKALYDVSVPTFRQAVQILAAEGLVTTRQGRATKVTERPPVSQPEVFEFDPPTPDARDGFRDWCAVGWQVPRSADHVLAIAARYAAALNVEPFTDVFILARYLTHATGIPAIHRTVVPVATALAVPDLQHDPFRMPAELYLILTVAGYRLDWHTSTTAQKPSTDDAAVLDIEDGSPVLVHTRLTCSTDGRPLALEETRLPSLRVCIRNR